MSLLIDTLTLLEEHSTACPDSSDLLANMLVLTSRLRDLRSGIVSDEAPHEHRVRREQSDIAGVSPPRTRPLLEAATLDAAASALACARCLLAVHAEANHPMNIPARELPRALGAARALVNDVKIALIASHDSAARDSQHRYVVDG